MTEEASKPEKPLLDKLGVKSGMRVLVVDVKDEGFIADLRARTDGVVVGEASSSARSFETPLHPPGGGLRGSSGRARHSVIAGRDGYDAVFVAVNKPEDLGQFAALKEAIEPDGAVWAVFRKGRKDFNENDVLRGGLDAGLVDVKVVRFSDTHTASKFVIRKAERASR